MMDHGEVELDVFKNTNLQFCFRQSGLINVAAPTVTMEHRVKVPPLINPQRQAETTGHSDHLDVFPTN